MLALRIRIKQQRPPEMMVREWNAWVAAGFKAIGEHWVREFLPLHFTPGAVQRYRYSARARKYRERKLRARLLRDRRGRRFVPIKPPLPLVYSSEMRDELTNRPMAAFNIRATATSNKAQVKVPLRLPHPMRAQQLSELRASIRAEEELLVKLLFEFLKQVIREQTSVKVEAFGGFRS